MSWELTKEQYRDYRKRDAELHKKIIDIVSESAETDMEFFRNLLIAQKIIALEVHNFTDITYEQEVANGY